MNPEEMQALLEQKFAKVQQDLAAAQAASATKEEILQLTASIKTQGEALQDFMDSQKENAIKDFGVQFREFLVKNQETIVDLYKKGSGTIEFIPKAVGDMTTGSGGDVAAAPDNHNTQLGGWNFRNDNPLINLCTMIATDSPSYPYTELSPKDGDYTFVAEGAVKPQIDFKWENRYAEPKKIAAYEIFTEESIRDIKRLESVAKSYLRSKHDLFKAKALYFGDGLGANAKGATTYGRVFVAGGMALKVVEPTFMDVINAVITDIFVTHNYADEASYSPNVALVSPVDFFLNLVAAKDKNGVPMYPQASLFNQVSIGGLLIKPWEEIPAGKIFVADMSKYNISSWVPYSVRIGWINDQFITNKFTMVGESRFHAFVKNMDEQAFVYDDIATIMTAIKKV